MRRHLLAFYKVAKCRDNAPLIISVGHLFLEEDGSGSDNLGGDFVN